jgi:peptide/nickel transport system permease protein
VFSYLIRRLLWMIPTFLGILVINFAVLRLQGPTLSSEMDKVARGDAGAKDARLVATGVENYLGRFRSTGLDLPALINLRGFVGKDDVVRMIERTDRSTVTAEREHERNRREKDLWMQGELLVQPLIEVLADDALSDLHGPASMALSLCAYYPLNPEDLKRLSVDEQRKRRVRNHELKDLRIEFDNSREHGFKTSDEKYAEKREKIADFWQRYRADFERTVGKRWGAVFAQTGFVDFMGKLATGNLYSFKRQEYVFSLIADRWQISFWLNFISIAIAWSISIPLGIRSARRIGTLEDRVTTNALFLLWSLPSFFVGTLFLHHFCTDSGTGTQTTKAWFPNSGLSSEGSLWMGTPRYLLDLAWHAFLPLVVLCYSSFTSLSRYMRADMLEQLNSDYVRTARAKGCSDDQVIYGHAMRNGMVTMITLGSGLLAELFGGFVFVELIFSIPGLGKLLLEAAIDQDAPLVMGSTVISVGLLLISILIADILYAVVDPRVRSRYG